MHYIRDMWNATSKSNVEPKYLKLNLDKGHSFTV